MSYAIALADVLAAEQRIRGQIHLTPVLQSRTLSALSGCELHFKCENLQRTGAFKIRGAMNAVLSLSDETAASGVVTHSSGNHAQALAVAAATRGVPCHVVMPTTAPRAKHAAVAGYGATIYPCEPTLKARESGAKAVAQRTGASLVPPFDYAPVMAGQGTAVLELLAQAEDLDAVLTPVGGGGLLSGTAIASRGTQPSLRVFGAEPLAADDTARSKAAGQRLGNQSANSIADGLLTSVGALTWPIIEREVEEVFTVTEAQIIDAMRLVFERMKLVIEPSAAVAVAVALSGVLKERGVRRAGIILSGGNVDVERLPF